MLLLTIVVSWRSYAAERVTEFEALVARVVEATSPGDVMTYGEVALEAGRPGAARAVGSILAKGGVDGWWLVVTSTGRLVPGIEAEHAQRFVAEGVEIRNGRVVVSRHR